MKIYNYDTNGIYTCDSLADESPLEAGIFLMPANSTEIAPPELTEGNQAIFIAGAWMVQAIPAPDQPVEPVLTAEELNEQAKANIQATLDKIDSEKIRPSSDIVAALAAGQKAQSYSVNKLQTLEAQAVTLRAQLAALTA
jgi:hypothetical protein